MSTQAFVSLTWIYQLAMKMAEISVQEIYGPQARLLQSDIQEAVPEEDLKKIDIRVLALTGHDQTEILHVSCFINDHGDTPPIPTRSSVWGEEILTKQFQFHSSPYYSNDIEAEEIS